jgi:hypothetical protein
LHVVTTAQRARLVVAMGLLNLILATVALTAGLVGPTQRDDGIAAIGSPGPSVGAVVPSSSAAPTPSASTGGGTEPSPPSVGPSVEPSIAPTPGPSTEPAASTPPSEGPIVALAPTPTPGSTNAGRPPVVATPRPTASPTAKPTAHPTAKPTTNPTAKPTPRPTSTPAPISGKAKKPRPPCPGDGTGPPGHNKVQPAPGRPCAAKDNGKGKGGGGNGMVVVLPLAIGGLAATIRTRLALGSRRVVRMTRSKAGRRGAGRPPREG